MAPYCQVFAFCSELFPYVRRGYSNSLSSSLFYWTLGIYYFLSHILLHSEATAKAWSNFLDCLMAQSFIFYEHWKKFFSLYKKIYKISLLKKKQNKKNPKPKPQKTPLVNSPPRENICCCFRVCLLLGKEESIKLYRLSVLLWWW